MHRKEQCSPQSVQRSENCLGFFRIGGFFVFLLSLDSTGFGFGGRRGRLRTILGSVSGSATEHTEVVFETALAFLRSELSILSELVGECGGISGGGWLAGVVTRVLIVLVLRSLWDPWGMFFIHLTYETKISNHKGMISGWMKLG